jgi:hypothetical protein
MTSNPSKCKSSYLIFFCTNLVGQNLSVVLCEVIVLGGVVTGYFLQEFLWPKYVICNSIVDGHTVQQKTLLTYAGLLYMKQHNQASIMHFNIDKMSQLAKHYQLLPFLC